MECAICKAYTGMVFKVQFPDPEVGTVIICPICMELYVDPAIRNRAEVTRVEL